jgi:hypothetical protein
MREVFGLHPFTEKNLSRFFKIHFHFPRILPGKGRDEQAKNIFENFGRVVLEGEWFWSNPPEVVSGIGRWGLTSP